MSHRLFADSATASGVRWLVISLMLAAVGDLVLDVPYYFGTAIPGLAANRPGITERACNGRVRRRHLRRGRPDADRGVQRMGRTNRSDRLRALAGRTASRPRGIRACGAVALRLGRAL